MFQFPGFPSYTYWFSVWSIPLQYRGFPIRKSAGRSLFAALRSLSQLVTSFFGSWCQGIHLMLLFAWTFLYLSIAVLFFELLESLLNRIWFTLRSNFAITFLSCSYHLSVKLCFTLYFWKDLYFTNLVKYLSSLSVRFILKFTLFDFQWTFRFRIRLLLKSGGLKWTRTTDLALIRRAL